MQSTIMKRSVVISGHKTSISIEDDFWNALREIAKERKQSVPHLLTSIDASRSHANFSSAIRMFVLNYYQNRVKNRQALEEFNFAADAPHGNGQSPPLVEELR